MGTEAFDAYRVLFVIISEAHINLSRQKMYLPLLNRKKVLRKGDPSVVIVGKSHILDEYTLFINCSGMVRLGVMFSTVLWSYRMDSNSVIHSSSVSVKNLVLEFSFFSQRQQLPLWVVAPVITNF